MPRRTFLYISTETRQYKRKEAPEAQAFHMADRVNSFEVEGPEAPGKLLESYLALLNCLQPTTAKGRGVCRPWCVPQTVDELRRESSRSLSASWLTPLSFVFPTRHSERRLIWFRYRGEACARTRTGELFTRSCRRLALARQL
jgi:hypothetical protein